MDLDYQLLNVIRQRRYVIRGLGPGSTELVYNRKSQSWDFVSLRTKKVIAYTKDTDDYPLGTHKWTIGNDAIACSPKGDEYKRVLKLTGCRENEFTCNDGQCIRIKSLLYFQIKINLALFSHYLKKQLSDSHPHLLQMGFTGWSDLVPRSGPIWLESQ